MSRTLPEWTWGSPSAGALVTAEPPRGVTVSYRRRVRGSAPDGSGPARGGGRLHPPPHPAPARRQQDLGGGEEGEVPRQLPLDHGRVGTEPVEHGKERLEQPVG